MSDPNELSAPRDPGSYGRTGPMGMGLGVIVDLRILSCLIVMAACESAADDVGVGDTDIDACDDVGVLCVVAGIPGSAGKPQDGLAAVASILYAPGDVAVDGTSGRWWIADSNNHVIREVDAAGVAHVVLGTGFPTMDDGGPALEEPVNQPSTLHHDPSDGGRLWVTMVGSNRIGRLDRDAASFALPYGSGTKGFGGDEGPAAQAAFWRPTSTAFDADGHMYVADRMNQVVRRIDTDHVVTTIAGQVGVIGYAGDGGPALAAELSAPADSEMDPANRIDVRDGRLVIADTGNHAVRVIDLATGLIDTLAGGHGRGTEDDPDGDGDARFDQPHDVVIDADGTVYVADTGNSCVRAITSDGAVTTVAGQCGVPGPAELHGEATAATLDWPSGLALDEDGRLWIADTHNHVIRRVRIRE